MCVLCPCEKALRASEARTRELENAAIARAKADAAELDTSARDDAMRQMLTEILNPKLQLLMTDSSREESGVAGGGGADGAEDKDDGADGATPARPNRLASTAAAASGLDPQAIALAAEARDVRKEAEFMSRLGQGQSTHTTFTLPYLSAFTRDTFYLRRSPPVKNTYLPQSIRLKLSVYMCVSRRPWTRTPSSPTRGGERQRGGSQDGVVEESRRGGR